MVFIYIKSYYALRDMIPEKLYYKWSARNLFNTAYKQISNHARITDKIKHIFWSYYNYNRKYMHSIWIWRCSNNILLYSRKLGISK